MAHGGSHHRGRSRDCGGGGQCPGPQVASSGAADAGLPRVRAGLRSQSGKSSHALRGGAAAVPPGPAVLGESHHLQERHPTRPARHPDHLDGVRGGHRLRRGVDRVVAGHPVESRADPGGRRRPARRHCCGRPGQGPAPPPVNAAEGREPHQRRHRPGGLHHRRRPGARRPVHPLGHHAHGRGLVLRWDPHRDRRRRGRLPGFSSPPRTHHHQHGPPGHPVRRLPGRGAGARLWCAGGGGGGPDHLDAVEPGQHPRVAHPGGTFLAIGHQPAQRRPVPADRYRDTPADRQLQFL